MAKYVFFVDRRNRGEDPIRCVADLPFSKPEDLLTFEGGKITVHANGSSYVVDVDSGMDLAEKQFRIQCQKVRDLVIPKDDEKPVKTTKRSESGFQE